MKIEFIILLTIFVVLGFLGVVGFLVEKLLRKKLNIRKRSGFFYKHVNSFHKWGDILIVISYLIISFYLLFEDKYLSYSIIIFIFIFILNIFRALMEYIFARQTKEYILTIFALLLFLICMCVFYFVFNKLGVF